MKTTIGTIFPCSPNLKIEFSQGKDAKPRTVCNHLYSWCTQSSMMHMSSPLLQAVISSMANATKFQFGGMEENTEDLQNLLQ